MTLRLHADQLAKSGGAPPGLKLHLGCGHNILPGWLNTDVTPSVDADYLDCTARLPFAENCFAAVFCEHLIEHIDKPRARGLTQEVFRVLRSGGLFRVVTPSLEAFAQMALDPEGDNSRKYLEFIRRFTQNAQADIADAINSIFYLHGHQHVYRKPELAAMLQEAGFTDVRLTRAGSHNDPVFAGADAHGKVIGAEINAIEAFGIEARKP